MTDIRNTDNIIDSHDVIARIDELTEERDALAEDIKEAESRLQGIDADDDSGPLDEARHALAAWDGADELAALEALVKEGEAYAPDWPHGETLIHASYFTEYAEQLADDIGAIDRDAGWPTTHIDWEAAAEDLKQDYTSIYFDGEEYFVR